MAWRHIVIGTRCSWLHGDSRGFRNRDHRIHSSGDYKARPPQGEHAGLLCYHVKRSGEAVNLDIELRLIICRKFVLKMQLLGHRVIACAVGARHLRALVDLASDDGEVKKTVGQCKQKSSHAVRKYKPGRIWAEGGSYKRIKDADHLHNTYGYIRTRQDPGTVIWSHNTDEDWIGNPLVGVIVMEAGKKQLRIYPTQAGV